MRHEQSNSAVRLWHGKSSPTASSPAVRSSRHDLLDQAQLLHYLASPIVDTSDDGGSHGGSARRDNGGMPEEAAAKH